MSRFSAIITATTECEITVEAANEAEALTKINNGEFSRVRLHDGGLHITERFNDIDINKESFGQD